MESNIHKVAREAGVSSMTASRALNMRPHVNEQTRKRVFEAAERLNYSPRAEGQRLTALKSGGQSRTGNIGCVVFPLFAKYSDPFFSELLEEVDRVLIERQLHHYFTYSLKELEDPALFLRMVNPHVVDGCLLIGVGDLFREEIEKIRKRLPHLVVLSDSLDDEQISCVYSDSTKAGYIATGHLIKLGHKRIGCLTGFIGRDPYSDMRFNGYQQALKEAGIEFNAKLVKEGKYQVEATLTATVELLNEKPSPTALFVTSDPMAIIAYKAIQTRGLKIPDDISVVGCDNVRMGSLLNPSLTTVGMDKHEIAKAAIQKLTDKISDESSSSARIVLPVKLVERESARKLR